jgi:hypothetical protein
MGFLGKEDKGVSALAELAGGYTPRADMYCNLKHTDCKDLIWTIN